jgi:chemotaxis protein CheX
MSRAEAGATTLEALVIETIQNAAIRVFSTMLTKELTPQPPHLETESAAVTEGVIAQISVVGPCSMTSLVCCSADVARQIASAMLMQECAAVDAEVLDAMAEIANMIVGNVKTDLDAQMGGVSLSIPTVTYGRNFTVHNHSNRWMIVPFLMDAQPFNIKVCFEPETESRRSKSGAAAVCMTPGCPSHAPGWNVGI